MSVDQETSLDVKLQLGELSETVEVSAGTPLLKTERSDVATTFSEKTVASLPDPEPALHRLRAVDAGRAGHDLPDRIERGPARIVSEGRQRPELRRVGAPARRHRQSRCAAGPDRDQPDARIGHRGQGHDRQLRRRVRRDRRRHQRADEVRHEQPSAARVSHFLRNDVFNARNPFTQFQKIPGTDRYIPVTQWNQFGGALGGPVVKNKVFFFGDYQGTRRNTGGSALLRVPSAAERQGDLSGLGVDIFDPASGATLADRQQFAGNRIPAARLSPQAQNLLELIPLPNIEGTVRDQPNYVGSGTIKFNEDLANTRWDYFLSGRTHVFGRYSLADYRMDSPGIFGELAGGRGFDEAAPFAGVSRTRNQSIAAGFDHTLSPNLLTDFRFGWFRYRVNVDPGRRQREPGDRGGHSRLEHRRFQPRDAGVPPQRLRAWRQRRQPVQLRLRAAVRALQLPAAPERAAVPVRQQLDEAPGQPHHQVRRGHPPRDEPAHSERSAPRRRVAVQRGADAGPDRRRFGAGVVPARRRQRVRALRQQRDGRRGTAESLVLLRTGSVEGHAAS